VEAVNRTLVVFRSPAFNTSERKPYFVNDGCFGDDVARWMISRLRSLDIETDDEPGQEDFGWYFGFRTADGSYSFVIGYRPDDPVGDWIGTVERHCGFVASLFGGRSKGITAAAAGAIHRALSGAPEITSLSWHYDRRFDEGNEKGADSPAAG